MLLKMTGIFPPAILEFNVSLYYSATFSSPLSTEVHNKCFTKACNIVFPLWSVEEILSGSRQKLQTRGGAAVQKQPSVKEYAH